MAVVAVVAGSIRAHDEKKRREEKRRENSSARVERKKGRTACAEPDADAIGK